MMNEREIRYMKAYALALASMLLSIAAIVTIHNHSLETKVERPFAESIEQSATIKQKLLNSHKKVMVVRQALIDYYKKSGSRFPIDMAYAVMKTKRPKLMAAMSVVESDGNYTVRNGGYQNKHHGAWQVNPKWWGAVSDDPLEQALQAEHVLDTYLDQTKGDLIQALNKYGGCTKGLYASTIINEMNNVPDIF